MPRDKTRMPPYDTKEIEQAALALVARYGSKRKAERKAMERQARSGPATSGVYYWGSVAQAIRKLK